LPTSLPASHGHCELMEAVCADEPTLLPHLEDGMMQWSRVVAEVC
jgi:hypothetical protein